MNVLHFLRVALILAVVPGMAISTYAGTYTVTSADDDGVGTLRWAIDQANAEAVINPAETSTINFDSSVSTITLLSALPVVTGSLTIDSSGAPNLAIGGGITENGSTGVARLVAGTGGLELAGSSSYTGGTTINAGGTLKVGTNPTSSSVSAFGSQSNMTVVQGTLDLNGHDQGVGSLTGYGTVLNSQNGTQKSFTVGNSDATSTFRGILADNAGGGSTGTLGLTKTGAGTLTLTKNNTYTGETRIEGGSLVLAKSSSALDGATLVLDATVGVTTADGAVAQWADQSGHGNHANASIGQVVQSTLNNGMPSLSFAGGGSLLSNVDSSRPSYTVLAVVEASAGQIIYSAENGVKLTLIQTSVTPPRDRLFASNTFRAPLGTLLSTGLNPINTPTLYGVSLSPDSLAYYVNGVANGSFATQTYDESSPAPASTYIGKFFDGEISAVAIFESILTGNQLAEAQAYLMGKFVGAPALQNGSLSEYSPVNITTSGASLDLNGNTQTLASLSGVAGTSVYLRGSALSIGANNQDSTYAGVISDSHAVGAGSVNKIGASKLTLTGENTYTSPTTVTAGTLQIGDGGATGSLAGNIVNNAAVAFNRNNDLTYSGNISGTGTVAKLGPNTLTLTGTISTAGSTTISDGTLQIGDGGATGAIVGNVTNHGTLAFNRSADLTYNGIVSGSGNLHKLGSNTLTLTAAQSYTGTTTLDNGTLTITSTGSLAPQSAVTVNAGRLNVLGTVGGPMTIAAGGELSGTGSVQAVTLQSGARINLQDNGVSPFNAASLTLTGAARFSLDMGESAANVLNLSGLAAFGSHNLTIDVNNLGLLPDTAYPIMNAAGGLDSTHFQMGTVTGITLLGNTPVFGGNSSSVTLTFVETPSAPRAFFNGQAGGNFSNLANFTTTSGGSTPIGLGVGQRTDVVIPANGGSAAPNVSQDIRINSLTFAGGTGAADVEVGGSHLLVIDAKNTTGSGGLNTAPNGILVESGAGNATISAPIALGSDQTWTVTDAATTLTASGGVSNGSTGSGLTKAGLGTLVLSGENTYTGGTTISQGTLQIGNGGPSGSLHGDVLNNSNLVFNQTGSTEFAGNASGSGSLRKAGTNTLTLTGANTHTGGTTIDGGTLQIGNGGTSGSLSGPVNNSGYLVFNRSNDSTFEGAVSGSGSLVKKGSGALTVSAALTYTGETTIDGGRIVLSTTSGTLSSLSAVNLTANGTALDLNGSTQTVASISGVAGSSVILGGGSLTAGGDNTSVIFPGTITDVGSASGQTGGMFTKVGTGTLTLTASADASRAGTTVSGGTLALSGNGRLADTGRLIMNGGTFDLGSIDDTVGAVTLTSGSISGTGTLTGTSYAVQAGTIAPKLAGSGSLTKTGSGTVTLSGNNSFTGGTTVSAGTLELRGNGRLANSGALTVSGGTFDIGAINDTVGAVNLSSGSISGSGTLTGSSYAVQSGTITSNLAGGGGLTKTGSGTVTLTGANTYSGGTTVSGGTLELSGNGYLSSSGALAVNSGGTLRVDGAIGNTVGAVTSAGTISGTGTLTGTSYALHDGSISANLAGSGFLTVTVSSRATLSGDNSYTGGTNLRTGSLILGSSGALGSTGVISWLGGYLQYSALNTTDYSNRFNTTTGQLYRVNTDGQDVTWASSLVSGGTLFKIGAGTLTLSGTINAQGVTSLQGGVLALASFGALPIIANSIDMGGSTLQFSAANTRDYSSSFMTTANRQYRIDTNGQDVHFGTRLAGSGSIVVKTGEGTLSMNAANTYTGSTTVSGGTLMFESRAALYNSNTASWTASNLSVGAGAQAAFRVGGANEFTEADVATLAALGTSSGGFLSGSALGLDTTNAGTFTYSGILADTNGGANVLGLAKLGVGTLILSGNNTYSGGTVVEAGRIEVSSDTNLGAISGALTLNGGTFHNSTNMISTRDVVLGSNGGTLELGNGFLTLTKAISGTGGLTKTNGNFLTLTGAQTYQGATAIGGGTLKIDNGSLASSSVTIDAGATLLFSNNGSYANSISGTGTLKREFSGTTVLLGAVASTIQTVVEGGTLQVGNGGTTGEFGGNVTLNGSSTLAFNRSGTSTFDGVISGNGNVTKQGSGKVTLGGTNTYTGDTTISGGTLSVNGSLLSDVIVQAGGTLGGSGSIGGDVMIENGGSVSPGNSPGQLTLEEDFTLDSGSFVLMEIGGTAAGTFDQLDVQGVFAAGGTLSLFLIDAFVPTEGDSFLIFNGSTPGFDTGSFTLTTNLGNGLLWDTSNLASTGVVSVVPEPSVWATFTLSLSVIFFRRRRSAA